MLVGHSETSLWEGAHYLTRLSVFPAAVGAQPMGNGTCVLVGDDEAFLQEAAAIAAKELGCKFFAGRLKYEMESHNQQKFDQLPLAERCTATMHLLTDLELLAHTDYFVGEAPGCPLSQVLMQYRSLALQPEVGTQAVPLLARMLVYRTRVLCIGTLRASAPLCYSAPEPAQFREEARASLPRSICNT